MDLPSISEQMKRWFEKSEYFVTRVQTLEEENKFQKLKILELEKKIKENRVCVCVERHEEQTIEESGMDGSTVMCLSSESVDSPVGEIRVRDEQVGEFMTCNLQTETPSMDEDTTIDIREEDGGYEQSKVKSDGNNTIHDTVPLDPLNVGPSSDIPNQHEIDRSIQRMFSSANQVSNNEMDSDDFGTEVGTDPEHNHNTTTELTRNVLDQKVLKSQPQVSNRRLFGQNDSDFTTHTGEMTHTCETCSETFETQCKLLEQKRSHTGAIGIRTNVQTPFKCSVCETSFSTESILTDHLRTHTGEKSIQDGKVFSAKRNLPVENEKVNAHHGRLKRQRSVETDVEVCNDEKIPEVGEEIDPPCVVERDPLKIKQFDFDNTANCTSEQPSQVVKMSSLLSLPNSVWSHILDHMDLHNLKKLRCVCKQTKNMVEQPEYLQKFKITLETTEDQEKVLSSDVPWNNFVLNIRYYYYLPEFISHFGKTIKHLEIEEIETIDIPSIFSDLTPRIQTLKTDMVHNNPHTFETTIWAKNFIELKELDIHEIMNFPGAPKSLFEIILDNCTHHLQHLWIPSLTQSDDSEATESQYTRLIFQPVLNYLIRIEQSKVQTNLVIEFHRGIVLLNPRILLAIVEISSRLGIRLHNVPIHGFPMDHPALTLAHREMFEESIVSIVEYVGYEMLSRLGSNKRRYVPKNTKIHVRINMNCSDIYYQGYEICGPIHSMQVSYGFIRYGQPYQDLFQTQWPTVGRLEIDWLSEREGSPLFNFGRDISSSFQNLKDLSVSWSPCMRSEDFHALIHALPNLEKLKVSKSNLTDEGLLGNDLTHPHPCILQMKRLKHLELLRCSELTDLSFKNAFRFMNLHTFKWIYTDKDKSRVTFLNGISSLNSIDGGLKDSVQHLELTTTRNCSREEVDEFVNKFKSLSYFSMKKLSEIEMENGWGDDASSLHPSNFSHHWHHNIEMMKKWENYSENSNDENEWEGYPENSDESGNDEIENGFSEEDDEDQLDKW